MTLDSDCSTMEYNVLRIDLSTIEKTTNHNKIRRV